MKELTILIVFVSLFSAIAYSEPETDRITVNCGSIGVLLRKNTQWTPGRFDYKGKSMTTEKSSYGTVFMFPDIGFIGTGHFENEPENIQSLDFYLDNQLVENPGKELSGKTFRFERKSKIRQFDLHNTIEINDQQIIETARVKAHEAVPLKLIYHFMHAWETGSSDYLAGIDSQPEVIISGKLENTEVDKRKFFINRSVDWVAIYHSTNQQFAVSRLVKKPTDVPETSKIWNVPGAYRKYYHTSFQNQTVPAGFEGTWKMITSFGDASPAEWQAAAKAMAKQILTPQLAQPD